MNIEYVTATIELVFIIWFGIALLTEDHHHE